MTTIYDAVKQACLSLPETEEQVSHGFPTYRVRDKQFATYSVNHHGDGKVALLLNASLETQQMLTQSAPKIFFRPPYIGGKGWVGMELNKGLSWQRVGQLILDAYSRTAPAALANSVDKLNVNPPTEEMSEEDINPLKSAANQKILTTLREFCLQLPETSEDTQFGNPAFRAGKKSFCNLTSRSGRTTLQLWVGPERQVSLTSFDKRFSIPAYVGHNGWINLNITGKQNWEEIRELLLISYRHFALKRMLKALEHQSPGG